MSDKEKPLYDNDSFKLGWMQGYLHGSMIQAQSLSELKKNIEYALKRTEYKGINPKDPEQ